MIIVPLYSPCEPCTQLGNHSQSQHQGLEPPQPDDSSGPQVHEHANEEYIIIIKG